MDSPASEAVSDAAGLRAGALAGRRGRWTTTATCVVFGLSGVPALVDQVCWQRILALHSGVGAVSVTLIVAAFMVGLGLGGQVGGRLSRRIGPRAALWTFAAVEVGIGAFAWFSGPFYHKLPGLDPSWFVGTNWRVGVGHLLLLLPPTLLMGMTLPLLVRALVHDAPEAARLVGMLYGLNLLGAAVGALAAPWALVPYLGIVGALRFGAVCNFLGAAGVLAVGSIAVAPDAEEVDTDDGRMADGPAASGPVRPGFGLWTALYFVTGFLAIALEVVWFRMIDVGVKSTAFTFGTVLAVYLGGQAVGSLLGARYAGRFRDPLAVFLGCQCAVLLYAGLSTVVLTVLPPWTVGLGWYFDYWAAYEPIEPGMRTIAATLALYGLFPALLFGVPTVLMGLAFTVLQTGVQDEARTSGFKVGVLQSANIAGCVAGALLVGLWWMADPGTATTLRVMVGSGVVFAGWLAAEVRRREPERRGAGWPVALALGLALLAATALMPGPYAFWARFHGLRDGTALISEGVAGVSALVPEGGRWRMSVNGKGQSHVPFGNIHSRLGALPATMHARPERVAIIGLGSGDTAWAAGCRLETRALTVFEVSGRELPLLRRLSERERLPHLDSFLDDPRYSVVVADGRKALESSSQRYDFIEADAIRPNGSYSGNLYSVEFFRLCARKLRPGGLMCSWSPTPRTRASFLRGFPHVVEFDNGVVLIGSNEPIALDVDAWRRRLESQEVTGYLGPDVVAQCVAALPSARVVPASDRGGSDQVNTDLFPLDEYQGPGR